MTTAMVVHQLPGRIRLRIPAKRQDRGYFSMLSEHMEAIEGVRALRINPSTGSVTVQYDGDLDLLLQRMQERMPHLVVEKSRPANSDSSYSIRRPFTLVSGRRLSPMLMMGTALAAVGIVQTLRGKIAVPSITAFWYAFEAFRQSKNGGT